MKASDLVSCFSVRGDGDVISQPYLCRHLIPCYLTYDLIAPSPDLFPSFFLLLIKNDLWAQRQRTTRLVGALTPIKELGYGRSGSNQPLYGR